MKPASALLLSLFSLFGLVSTSAWGRPLADLLQARDGLLSGSGETSTASALPSGIGNFKPGGNIDLSVEIDIDTTGLNGGQIAGISIGASIGLPVVSAILYFTIIGL